MSESHPIPETHPLLLRQEDSILVLVDCQERLWPAIHASEDLTRRLGILLEAATLLRIPVLLTEQNPTGLGHTIAPLRSKAKDAPVITKLSFSCCRDVQFREAIRSLGRTTLVLAGVETHICVLQTAHDALAEGYTVQVLADGCGSRAPEMRQLGLSRMERAGAVISSIESALFEWMVRSDHAEFRSVSRLLK